MERASSTTSTSIRSSPLGRFNSTTLDTGIRHSFSGGSLDRVREGYGNVDIVASPLEDSAPSTPTEGARNQAPGIQDRRRSHRPQSVRYGSGDSARRGRGGKGLGPGLPVKTSPPRSQTMDDVRSRMRMQDDESSDAYEDAAESVASSQPSRTPSRNESGDMGEEQTPVGLGINGGTSSNTSQSTINGSKGGVNGQPRSSTEKHARNNTAEKVPAIVRESIDTVRQEQLRSTSPEAVSAQSSRPVSEMSNMSREAAGGRTLEQELDGDSSIQSSPVDNDRTPVLPSHSRQNNSETAPTLAKLSRTSMEVSPTRQPRPHSRQDAAEAIQVAPASSSETSTERNLSLSGIRAGLADHSRQNTADSIPTLAPPTSNDDRDRSLSPRRQSPVRTVHGLSGDVLVSSSAPPSSAGRLRALDSRNIGERPGSTSPQPPGLMRTASTRMGAFLGRMGTIRKSGRSPPAPRQGSFTGERRNTATSTTSVTSGGNESLATISDVSEMDHRKRVRLSLKDQFQYLRKQEENSALEDGYFFDGDEESTPRKASDIGALGSPSPLSEVPESRSQRTPSTPGLLRSPPMNPSLPPGTASGLTAGPAEEPRPVDWDLWQAVVNEGPSAVAKTSGEELNQAIACGIPHAIRGVVWQVLAESKNEELENVYRTLKARGTADAEQLAPEPLRPAPMSRNSSQNNVNGITENGEKESQVSSSRSSIHSLQSSPPTPLASPPPSVQGDDHDLKGKLVVEKQKREAAALIKLEKAIKRDLGSRTSYNKFTQAAGLQDGLFGVCKAYALFDEGVGYAQGINFIAMPLLFNMTEEEAFTLLVRLMSKYDLRSMFIGDLAGLHLRLYQFERLLEDQDPALYCHLKRRHVSPELYATQWFLTLFAYRFPLQLVLQVYDLVFSEGLTAIMKFGLVLMQHNRDTLLAMKDMSQLTTFLKEKLFDVYIDKSPSASSLLDSGFFGSVTGGADKELYRADEMVRDACEITITDSTLAQYTAEWEEAQRQTQARDSELEDLRASHNALSVKVKVLEERSQAQDTEHVAIAGDLVRIKVENDTLLDENEGLKMKVEELQKLVDEQPAEIEERLKTEMDRIVQRNSEVQSENRVLKEEMEETEQALVMAKVERAQTQSDHDALIQKFANVQALLSDK